MTSTEARAPVAVAVMLHAWVNTPEGDCTYCDPTEETPDGWCIYTRSDFDDAGLVAPFDISDEQDFEDWESALAAGQARAAALGVQLHEY